jgi:cytochrome P450
VSVLLPTPLLHHDPAAFPDADRFDPQRWATRPAEHTYAPFGGGARRCVGEGLSRAPLAAYRFGS